MHMFFVNSAQMGIGFLYPAKPLTHLTQNTTCRDINSLLRLSRFCHDLIFRSTQFRHDWRQFAGLVNNSPLKGTDFKGHFEQQGVS